MKDVPTAIDEIIELLIECDDAYSNLEEDAKGSPLTDREYDLLKRKAFALDPANEYFIKVGSDVRGGKIKLPYQMGSLNQVYEGEVGDWVKKYNLDNKDVVYTHKLDGVSCMIVYNNGVMSIAYSRGNGIEGADITRHIKAIPSVPTSVAPIEYLVVRAEVIIKKDLFAQKYAADYKNPRNFVAGAMNRKQTDDSILKDLEVIVYEIVSSSFSIQFTKNRSLDLLRQYGFTVVDSCTVLGKTLDDVFLENTFKQVRNISDYELDGLVITVDDYASLQTQSNSSSLNPEHSVKYKVLDDDSIVETYVLDVHWEVSQHGYLKPRVEIVPVELFGTTVKFATGFNAGYISDFGIGRGAKIRITKSGMVIPYIVSVVSSVTPSLPPADAYGGWVWNDTKVEAVVINKEHPAIVQKQVLNFFEKFKVDQLKEATLNNIWNVLPSSKYDDVICDICDLTESEWLKAIGANGSKIYNSLHTRLQNATMETFLGASMHMGVGFGVRKAKKLLKDMQDVDNELWSLTTAQIVAKEGFDVKTAASVINGLPATKALLERLKTMGLINFIMEKKTSELSAVNVVMTGFRDADLQYQIESKGGKVGSGVSKKTTHLLAVDVASTSGKTQKARELGVKIMTPDEFKFEFDL